jgi:putative colanic acid biosynthesis UDP-glucose lipid carrier transferase
MITKQRSLLISALVTDVVLIIIAFLSAAVLAQSFATLRQHPVMFALLPLLAFIWYFTTASGIFYKEIGARFYFETAVQLVKNVAMQAFTIILFIFIVKDLLFQRNFLLYYSFFLFVLVLLRLIVFRKALKHNRASGSGAKKLVVIGNRKSAESFVEDISTITSLGYAHIEVFRIPGEPDIPFEQSLIDLQKYVEANGINEAIIAPSSLSETQILRLIKICNVMALHTFLLPDFLSLLTKKYSISTVGKYPLISIRTEPLEDIHLRLFKRTLDLLLTGIFFLFIGIWLFPLLLLLQKLLNPGPIFYIQRRVGRNNRIFRCYKLRTMTVIPPDAPYQPAKEDDDRITKFGKLLRKANLDELPQLINVLKGDMSLVGPRPHAVSFEEKYKEFVDEIRLRHLVKPGITGWAQIHGLRGDIPDPELNKAHINKRIQFDIWYVENWSFSLDLKIIFITLWQILSSNNQGV